MKTSDTYLKWATEFVMDEFDLTKDEALSLLMSNPEVLTPSFGWRIMLHHISKEYLYEVK